MRNDPNDLPEGAEDAEARERLARLARNVASIADIPWEELPYGPARGCLREMAYAGADVSAFRAADGRWQVRVEGSVESCAAWLARFHV
jgi:hypothetical protein